MKARQPIELVLTVDWPDGKGCVSYRETPANLADCPAALGKMLAKAQKEQAGDGDEVVIEQPSLLDA